MKKRTRMVMSILALLLGACSLNHNGNTYWTYPTCSKQACRVWYWIDYSDGSQDFWELGLTNGHGYYSHYRDGMPQ